MGLVVVQPPRKSTRIIVLKLVEHLLNSPDVMAALPVASRSLGLDAFESGRPSEQVLRVPSTYASTFLTTFPCTSVKR